jgi:hypothetical protein
MKMKRICFVIMLAGILAVGCASSGPAASSDKTMSGTWASEWEPVVNVLVFNSDGTATMTTSVAADAKDVEIKLQVRDGGKTLIVQSSGKRLNGKIEGGNYILTDFVKEPLTFYKTNGPTAVTGTTWAFENQQIGMTYAFNDDGTYRITASGAAAQVVEFLGERGDFLLTGTYSADGYRVIFKPTRKIYLQFNGYAGKVGPEEADTFAAIVINDILFLNGVTHKKK